MTFSLFPAVGRSELARRVGGLEQLGGAARMTFAEGPARGMEAIEVRSGGGLAFQILPDRGMGIGLASLCGGPLCWVSAAGAVAPWYYNPAGSGWLQSFGGGLMASCGLTNVGAACRVDGVEVGLHGRMSHTAARDVSVERRWIGDSFHIAVSGTILDYSVLGPALELRRTYDVVLGENRFRLRDEVANVGARPQPLFLLYHFNFGYPLLSETAVLDIAPQAAVSARDPAYAEAAADWRRLEAPRFGAEERVLQHRLSGGGATEARVRLENQIGDARVGVEMTFPLAALSHLTEWKMMGEREYVLGLEPGTCFASGREDALARGDVEILAPGATKTVDLSVAFSLTPNRSA